MSWHGRLDLQYRLDDDGRTIAHDRHDGPLRVLQRLYPEGPSICHHVLVHPPGGIVGGDVLDVDVDLGECAHAVLTTPGATRFYRSEGALAEQSVHARVASGARLEWLPLETLAYDGCVARNAVRVELEPGASMIGWDVLALGLPAADQAFTRGSFEQRLEIPGTWLERGRVAGGDSRLLDSPLGWAGRRVLATAWFASGEAMDDPARDALVDAARAWCEASPLASSAGVTSPDGCVVVARVLAERVEPAMALLVAMRGAWREAAWGLPPVTPRVWQT